MKPPLDKSKIPILSLACKSGFSGCGGLSMVVGESEEFKARGAGFLSAPEAWELRPCSLILASGSIFKNRNKKISKKRKCEIYQYY